MQHQQGRPKNLVHLAWIIPVAVIGGAALLVIGTVVFFIAIFVVHDLKKSVPNSPPGPPPPPAVRKTVPPGGFRPTTLPTQPSFDDAIRQARQYRLPPTTTHD